MYSLEYSTLFKKDFKKITKMSIPDIVDVGHPLAGNWLGFRDCHIKPDLVLIYRVDKTMLQLARIGSHSELF
ncbi:addiction module toxin RelE [Endozoicomonas sp. (ex Bugula neritina AB1)]|nr:addiction module toxin RelE [Endozoicomonas sp. (ex Bugula neritina AB1)]